MARLPARDTWVAALTPRLSPHAHQIAHQLKSSCSAASIAGVELHSLKPFTSSLADTKQRVDAKALAQMAKSNGDTLYCSSVC